MSAVLRDERHTNKPPASTAPTTTDAEHEPAKVREPEQHRNDRADDEEQAADIPCNRNRREIDLRIRFSRGRHELAWVTRVPAPQGDRHDHAARHRGQHEPAEHRPDRREQRHSQECQQRVCRSAACTRMAVVPEPKHNRKRDTEPNHRNSEPAEERPNRREQCECEHEQQVAAVPAGHERRHRTAHWRRGDDEGSRENEPREGRVATHVRGQLLERARARFAQLLLIVGESRDDECRARRLVEQDRCQLHEPFTRLWTIPGSHGCTSDRRAKRAEEDTVNASKASPGYRWRSPRRAPAPSDSTH